MSTDDDIGSNEDNVVNLSEMRQRTEAERRRRRKDAGGGGAGRGGGGDGAGGGGSTGGERPGRRIIVPRGALDLMRSLTQIGYTLARDAEGVAMVLPGEDPNRFWYYVYGEEFAEYLSTLYGDLTPQLTAFGRLRGMTTERCIREVQRTLRAESRNGPVRPFSRRYIEVDGTKYIDWGLPGDSRMMVVTERGWRLDTRYTTQRPRSDIPLIRTADMLPLPKPIEDRAKADEAFRLFEKRSGLSPDGFKLLILATGHAWSDGPGPVVQPMGPPAGHKTTLATRVQQLVDPTRNGPMHMPTKIDDLVVALRSSSCPAFDNQTDAMTTEMEDILCEAITGGRYVGRTLYTQGDLSRLKFQPKLIVLTSTNQLIRRVDLGTRGIVLDVQPMPHLADDVIDREAEFICAGVVTKLLDAAVMELRNRNRDYPGVDGRLNRFERNARARAEAFGWNDAEIAALLKRTQRDLQADITENDILVSVMVPYLRKWLSERDGALIEAGKPIATTAGELWRDVVDGSPALRSRDSRFPTEPSIFRRRLGERVDAFAAAGIRIEFGQRTSTVRPILISWQRPAGASARPPPSEEPPARCPVCAGEAWWRADETNGEWRCQACVEMPMVVHNLRQWTRPGPTRH
jgi:hypothetical protein